MSTDPYTDLIRVNWTDDFHAPVWRATPSGRQIRNRIFIGHELMAVYDAGPGWVLARRVVRDSGEA